MAGNQTWDRAFAIFDMVADSEESERIRVLDDVCAGDPVLRGQVESMLRAESEGSDFLNEKARDTVFTSLASVVPDALDPAVGRTVSRYTIRRRIGSGGMGAVYLADRADIGGQVALKLVRAELADPSSRKDGLPEDLANPARSKNPEWFVAIGICTHLGCSPTAVPQGTANPSLPADWPGGFFCPCHGSTFDGAGRVFKNKPAPTNLEIPPYTFVSASRLRIGDTA